MITLHDAYSTKGAAEFLYNLMKERENENDINISHSKTPTWRQHLAFMRKRSYRCWYIVSDGVGWVGSVSATMRNEIGIVLTRSARGQGIGPAAVKALMAQHKPLPAKASERSGEWLANINPNNQRSLRAFAKLGFRPIQVTWQFNRGESDGEAKG